MGVVVAVVSWWYITKRWSVAGEFKEVRGRRHQKQMPTSSSAIREFDKNPPKHDQCTTRRENLELQDDFDR